MKVDGKDINEWADIIAERRKQFKELLPEEKRKVIQATETIFDRWQAETDAMSESEENESPE
ncbi:MAG: hypothetical protein LBH84_01180 [Prevotellaceae bacterium]|jgi:hypothetical protein|nr:hypothetical protein [Prevotellaceae bacterium]